ncbi:DUF3592 domain-containing protein [Myxococcota bacterium]|nr:DUF3592 domain-containing protein [Myxococcota bacterium]MBU1533885.1 DUF3592 domain-containing protein [Myxococcota bacterium]
MSNIEDHMNQPMTTKTKTEITQELRKERKQTIIFFLIALASVPFLVTGIVLLNISPDWNETRGALVEWSKGGATGKNAGRRYGIYIKYTYQAPDGVTVGSHWCRPSMMSGFRSETTRDQYMTKLRKGDYLKVWYNPKNSRESTCKIATVSKYPVLGYMFVGMFVLILIGGLVFFLSGQKKK